VVASFEGSEYYLESSTSVQIQILDIVIDVMTDDTFVRGEEAFIGGQVRTSNGLLTHEPITIFLDNSKLAELVTDGQGEFEIKHNVNYDTTLGPHVIEYQLLEQTSTSTQYILVKSRTFLDVEAPEQGNPGDRIELVMTLQDDRSNPISNASIVVEEYSLSGFTDSNGQALTTLEISDDFMEQSLSLNCVFEGNDLYLPCTEMVEINLMQSSGFPWWLLAFIPVIGAALVGGYFLNKKREKKDPMPQVEITPDNIQPPLQKNKVVSGRLTTRIYIELPQIKDPFPDVWGIGENLQIRFIFADEKGLSLNDRKIELYINNQPVESTGVDDQGKTSLIRAFQSKGERTITCRFQGDDKYQPAEAIRPIRIVDYREEIVDLFATVKEWAKSNDVTLPVDSTPRDIEGRIIRGLQGINAAALDTLVRCFEETDYSTHEIGRKQYEEAFLSLMRVRASYGGQNGEGTQKANSTNNC